MIDLERRGDIFVLTMTDGENRWNTSFVRAFAEALDEVEASEGPAALVTTSADQKFFSNGLDLDWIQSGGGGRGGDRAAFGAEFMALQARVITLGVPTIAAVNGHAFGAGLMNALAHDVRIMREDRGFMCANELEIGMVIPDPEVALFKHKMSASAFHQTIILARRWTGPAAVEAGIAEASVSLDALVDTAIARAESLKHLANHRANMALQKERAYGENAVLNGPHGAAHLLRTHH